MKSLKQILKEAEKTNTAVGHFNIAETSVLKAIFEIVFETLLPELGESLVFVFSIQMLQIVAGILLLNALYQLYQVSFATAGFIEK